MKKKKKAPAEDILDTPALPLPTFGTGEVARILDVDIWRIQGYLDSPKYSLKPPDKLGSGRGSRRVFYAEDVYRLGIAEHLVRSGFSYKFISKALQQIDDEDLLGPFNQEGEELDLVYLLVGGEENLLVRGIGRDKTIRKMTEWAKSPSFYVLDLNAVIAEIQKRIGQV